MAQLRAIVPVYRAHHARQLVVRADPQLHECMIELKSDHVGLHAAHDGRLPDVEREPDSLGNVRIRIGHDEISKRKVDRRGVECLHQCGIDVRRCVGDREQVLGRDGTVRVACEAASGFGWERWIGTRGAFVGMKDFGASGKVDEVYKHFGITAEAIAEQADRKSTR